LEKSGPHCWGPVGTRGSEREGSRNSSQRGQLKLRSAICGEEGERRNSMTEMSLDSRNLQYRRGLGNRPGFKAKEGMLEGWHNPHLDQLAESYWRGNNGEGAWDEKRENGLGWKVFYPTSRRKRVASMSHEWAAHIVRGKCKTRLEGKYTRRLRPRRPFR